MHAAEPSTALPRPYCTGLPSLPLEAARYRPLCNNSNRYCASLRQTLPLDPSSRWLNWSFKAHPCGRLHHRCVESPRPLHPLKCGGLRTSCLRTHARRPNKCVYAGSACVSVTVDGMRIESSLSARQVYKRRRTETEQYRLAIPPALPRVNGTDRCSARRSPVRRLAGNWTLISPVWPTNFGESMIGAFHALHAIGPTQGLLVAGSGKLRHQWHRAANMWSEALALLWPGSKLELVGPPALSDESAVSVEGLRVCHTHDAFDEGRRAHQGLQMSLLGATARPRLNASMRPRSPLRVGIVTPSSSSVARRITNEDELVAGCPRGVLCEKIALDHAGIIANARRVVGYHALVALHGSHVTYAAFPERPFALLEVKPFSMYPSWFQHYYQTAFALDTWFYAFFADRPPAEEPGRVLQKVRRRTGGNKQPAVLPLSVFRQFVCAVAQRFGDFYAASGGGGGYRPRRRS